MTAPLEWPAQLKIGQIYDANSPAKNASSMGKLKKYTLDEHIKDHLDQVTILELTEELLALREGANLQKQKPQHFFWKHYYCDLCGQ